MEIKKNKELYDAPSTRVFEVKIEGVICQSGPLNNEGAQTRASLDGSTKKVSFDANDEISILSAKNTNTKFTTSAGGASATFSGTATDDSKFYAVYPYTAGLTLSGDVISGIVIPTSQWNNNWNRDDISYSGWDPKAPIAYATTTGSSLTFHNACAILKVTFPETSTFGRFTISANEPLAGTFSLDTSTGTLTPTSGSTTVTVGDPSDIFSGICTDCNGKTVYVAIAPGLGRGPEPPDRPPGGAQAGRHAHVFAGFLAGIKTILIFTTPTKFGKFWGHLFHFLQRIL